MAVRFESYYWDDFLELGTGPVVVMRYKGSGRVEVGVFLVDAFCLGVRDAYFAHLDGGDSIGSFLEECFNGDVPRPKPGAAGRKLVEGAVAYARSLGFQPHRDYRKGARVFGGIDPLDCAEEFVFGKDGKPFYVQGPAHDAADAKQVVDALARRLGPGGFHYLLALESGPMEDGGEEDGRPWLSSTLEVNAVSEAILEEFASEFLEKFPEFEGVYLTEIDDGSPARQLLRTGWKMASDQAEKVTREGLTSAIEFARLFWNAGFASESEIETMIDAIPDEDRAGFRSALEEHRRHLREDGGEAAYAIVDWKLMAEDEDSESVENPQLILAGVPLRPA